MIWQTAKASIDQSGVVIKTTLPPVGNLSEQVVIGWKDSRCISEEQRHLAWALIGQIGEWVGTQRSKLKGLNAEMKSMFLVHYFDQLSADAIKRFSLADVDMSTAKLYIDFLIDFIILNNISSKLNLLDSSQDQNHYIRSCLIHKKCCVCGKSTDLHHCEGSTVGMGRDRREIVHEGLQVMPLCRIHHMECHSIGQKAFNAKYHIQGGVIADSEICKIYKLKRSNEK